MPADDLPDDVGRKTAREQEAHLARTILRCIRRGAEAALPQRMGTIEFTGFECLHLLRHRVVGQPVRAQLVPDHGRSAHRRTPMHEGFGEALVRKQTGFHQAVEQLLQFSGAGGAGGTSRVGVTRRITGIGSICRTSRIRRQLALEFGPAVFTPCQRAQRARLQAGRSFQAAASCAAAPRGETP